MGFRAAAIYLRTLRKLAGISQEEIAYHIGVSNKQVWRWERGESEPSASSLAAFTRKVGGSPAHLHRLILSDDITDEEVSRLAEEWFHREQTDQEDIPTDQDLEDLSPLSNALERRNRAHDKDSKSARAMLESEVNMLNQIIALRSQVQGMQAQLQDVQNQLREHHTPLSLQAIAQAFLLLEAQSASDLQLQEEGQQHKSVQKTETEVLNQR